MILPNTIKKLLCPAFSVFLLCVVLFVASSTVLWAAEKKRSPRTQNTAKPVVKKKPAPLKWKGSSGSVEKKPTVGSATVGVDKPIYLWTNAAGQKTISDRPPQPGEYTQDLKIVGISARGSRVPAGISYIPGFTDLRQLGVASTNATSGANAAATAAEIAGAEAVAAELSALDDVSQQLQEQDEKLRGRQRRAARSGESGAVGKRTRARNEREKIAQAQEDIEQRREALQSQGSGDSLDDATQRFTDAQEIERQRQGAAVRKGSDVLLQFGGRK